MMIDVHIVLSGKQLRIIRDNGIEVMLTSMTQPTSQQFIEACVLATLEPSNRPGGVIDQHVSISDAYMPKSWKRFDSMIKLFEIKSIQIQRERRQKTILKRPEIAKPTGASADGFGSMLQKKEKYDATTDVPLKRGKMIWEHKTCPTLELECEGTKLSPDDIAALRRR